MNDKDNAMTRKEAFYSLFSKHKRIIFTFNHDTLGLEEFFQECLDNDSVSDNGDNDIIIYPYGTVFDTTALEEISKSLEKEVFTANKTLAAHSFNRSSRQDVEMRFTVNNAEMELENLYVTVAQQSKWAKFYYDYDDYDSKNRWKTFYIRYDLTFNLDKDFNLEDAYITFIDLNEAQYSVYPENEIDVEDMKSKIEDMYKLKKISDTYKGNWGIY